MTTATAERWGGVFFSVTLAVFGGLLAQKTRVSTVDGMGPPAASPSPQPAAPSSASSAHPTVNPSAPDGASKGSVGVAIRLIDVLDQAVYQAPPLSKVEFALGSHWRRMKAPFVGPHGSLGRVVQQIGFPSDPAHEAEADKTQKKLHPGAMGGVNQRQSIVAPTPSSIRHRFVVPRGALLETEVAVAGPPRAVNFEVAVTSAGLRHVVATKDVPLHDSHRWQALNADLSAYEGQGIELELAAQSNDESTAPAVAVWGSPVVLASSAAVAPYNVLWMSVDALRSDAIASFHDEAEDRRIVANNPPPLDAWLPALPEVAPTLDALTKQSVIFRHAWSVATFTRPGIAALISGERNSELGLSTTDWVIAQPDLARFYASQPPLLSLVLREHGFHTRAYVNDFFLVGYSQLGVDLGFESLDDYRDELKDTRLITDAVLSFLREHAQHRFAVMIHFNSPHAPFEPPKALLEQIPKPPRGPVDPIVRLYLGEVKKDDAAIGELLTELRRLGIEDRTIVVVTADHGETLSSAHDWEVMLDGKPQNMRYRHAPAMWEETARVPIILRLPGRLPQGARIDAPVQTVDILPTVLDLLGIARDPRMSGRSLLPLVAGKPIAERPVIVEGRASRSIQIGNYRLVERETKNPVMPFGSQHERTHELYNLKNDPGERVNIADSEHAIAVDLSQKLKAEMQRAREKAKGAAPDTSSVASESSVVHLAFASGGTSRRVTGVLRSVDGDGKPAGKLVLRSAALPQKAFQSDEATHGASVTLDFMTKPDVAVFVDAELAPNRSLAWSLELDGKPWPAAATHIGPLGIVVPAATGLGDPTLRASAVSHSVPWVDAKNELGLFVTLDPSAAGQIGLDQINRQATAETMQLMRDWGYVDSKP